jgi:hypothetical protein
VDFEPQLIELGRQLFEGRFPENCGNPLGGHFNNFFAPRFLDMYGIRYNIQLQRAGEMIVTTGIHQGINLGPSISIAGDFGNINFTKELFRNFSKN